MAEDFFDGLPDDLVVSILCKLSSFASSPSDLISILITCKRINKLGISPLVLSKVTAKALAIRAKNWSESAHKFLKQCADEGNLEACYTLGMIRFYCLESRASGASLMARAAIGSHTAALYALAVIQFNGRGARRTTRTSAPAWPCAPARRRSATLKISCNVEGGREGREGGVLIGWGVERNYGGCGE